MPKKMVVSSGVLVLVVLGLGLGLGGWPRPHTGSDGITINGGEIHRYPLDLQAGQAYRVTVDQYGIDLNPTLVTADGARLHMDRRIGEMGEEWVTLMPETAGTAFLEVEAFADVRPGVYTWRLEELPPDPDNARVVAMEALWRKALPMRQGDLCLRPIAAEIFEELADFYAARGLYATAAYNLLELARLQPSEEAVETSRKALDLALIGDDELEAARAYASIGFLSLRLFNLSQDKAWAESALWGLFNARRRYQGNDEGILYETNIASLFEAMYRLDETLAAFRLMLKHLAPDDPLAFFPHLNLGRLYQDELGDLPAALAEYQQALAHTGPSARPEEVASLLLNIATVTRDSGRPAEAVPLYQRARARLAGYRFPALEARIDLELAESLLRIDRTAEARALLLGVAEVDTGEAGEALILLADAALKAGRLDEAEGFLARSEPLCLKQDPNRMPRLRAAQARLARARRDPAEFALLEDAMRLVEQNREISSDTKVRTRVSARTYSIYRTAVERRMQEAHAPDDAWVRTAFETYERGRGRSLREVLLLGRGRSPDPIDLELIESWFVDPRPGPEAQAAWMRLQSGMAAGHARLPPDTARTLPEIQAALDDQTLLVATYLGDRSGYLWLVGRRLFRGVPLPAGQRQVAQWVREVREAMAADVAAPYRTPEAAKRLAELLIPEEVRSGAYSRLAVVADGVLGLLPWAALPLSENQMLVERTNLLFVPTASLLAAPSTRDTPRYTRDITVLADPVFKRNDGRMADVRGGGYARLAGTAEEARVIRSLAEDAGLTVAVYTGFEATRAKVLAPEAGRSRILHLATHGDLDEKAMIFAHYDAAGRPLPWALTMDDISRLDLSSELVVLSACRTAVGEHLSGEGLFSLSRSFLSAGAGRVAATLWNISDRTSPELMARFYAGLTTTTPEAALADAQRDMLKSYHPYYWAGFVVMGGGR